MPIEVISRADAIARGLKRYYTGVPCKHGHFGERYVSTRGCVVCDWDSKDPVKERVYKKRYAEKHPERIQAKRRAYYLANREKLLAKCHAWGLVNRKSKRGIKRPRPRSFPVTGEKA